MNFIYFNFSYLPSINGSYWCLVFLFRGKFKNVYYLYTLRLRGHSNSRENHWPRRAGSCCSRHINAHLRYYKIGNLPVTHYKLLNYCFCRAFLTLRKFYLSMIKLFCIYIYIYNWLQIIFYNQYDKWKSI